MDDGGDTVPAFGDVETAGSLNGDFLMAMDKRFPVLRQGCP